MDFPSCTLCPLCLILFCDDSMNALADEDNIHNLQDAEFCFGGDIFLKPRAKQLAQLISY